MLTNSLLGQRDASLTDVIDSRRTLSRSVLFGERPDPLTRRPCLGLASLIAPVTATTSCCQVGSFRGQRSTRPSADRPRRCDTTASGWLTSWAMDAVISLPGIVNARYTRRLRLRLVAQRPVRCVIPADCLSIRYGRVLDISKMLGLRQTMACALPDILRRSSRIECCIAKSRNGLWASWHRPYGPSPFFRVPFNINSRSLHEPANKARGSDANRVAGAGPAGALLVRSGGGGGGGGRLPERQSEAVSA